eukprot:gnl/Spiro4/28192_TR13945_c1_g1_i1.p1 gnl/Spiro4/28192_TR13945_c1_g1~~gnl/Spiro4/28192_TR13945_c1_g1_i1.p1  ORF type:complete len:448 (+),score=70.89 gnl/Spiro4/28192_TR13945_c1_g1_i1:196-1344(+)
MFVYQLRFQTDAELFDRWSAQFLNLVATGFALAIHFASWSWSVTHTSLTHSLLFVSTTPLIMVFLYFSRWAISQVLFPANRTLVEESNTAFKSETELTFSPVPVTDNSDFSPDPITDNADFSLDPITDNATFSRVPVADNAEFSSVPIINATEVGQHDFADRQDPPCSETVRAFFSPERSKPPTCLEAGGTGLAFVGVVVLIVSASLQLSDSAVSVAGDMAAFVGAVAMWVYLEVGGNLRQWMPLFLYAFPVTAAAGVFASCFSLLLEDATVLGVGNSSVFGYLGSLDRFGLSLCAALVSGIAGHTLANLALVHINPLVVSVTILWEPLVGSVLGWLAGVEEVPGLATLLSGPLLMAGLLLLTLGGRTKEASKDEDQNDHDT